LGVVVVARDPVRQVIDAVLILFDQEIERAGIPIAAPDDQQVLTGHAPPPF
jgi:hypothetical protein